MQIDDNFLKDKYDYSRFTNECYGDKQGINAVKRIAMQGSVKIVIELYLTLKNIVIILRPYIWIQIGLYSNLIWVYTVCDWL